MAVCPNMTATAFGPPDGDVVGDQRFEQSAGRARIVEHQIVLGDLDLTH